MAKKRARYKKINVPLNSAGNVAVYASPKVSDALSELIDDMSVYKGVRLSQVLEAVYEQGKKDGAADAFGRIEGAVEAAQKAIPHRRPGRPRKK